MLCPNQPALILAPMDGITDAPMRALQGECGAFSFAVSEFVRVSGEILPAKVFRRAIPELKFGSRTSSGLPVQVQILGGDPVRVANSAAVAVRCGAIAIDLNFGCPAPTVNRHDGGACLLKSPSRIRDLVAAVRSELPESIPVSAKLRLGWESIDEIHENAEMAASGGASWITIHARTRAQAYRPPVYWAPIAKVRNNLDIPVVANGDIQSLSDFRQCRDETGCQHFMIGRGALANPSLARQIAKELGIGSANPDLGYSWVELFDRLLALEIEYGFTHPRYAAMRFKQWLKLASSFGDFLWFDEFKLLETTEEILGLMRVKCGGERETVSAYS